MIRARISLPAVLLSVALLGCQKESPAVTEKLDTLIEKMDGLERKVASLEQKIGQIPTGGRQPPGQPPPRPMPAQPDPSATYSVPIEGDPVKGPATALVTVVEAVEFA